MSIHLIEQMRWLIAEQFAGPRAQGAATLCRSAAFETAAMGDMLHTVGTIHSCILDLGFHVDCFSRSSRRHAPHTACRLPASP